MGKQSVFTQSQARIHVATKLRWGYSSRDAWLVMDGEEIWRGRRYNTASWLQQYMRRSRDEVVEREFNCWHDRYPPNNHVRQMFNILACADMRIGWNTLSGWLFTEVDPVARKVLSRRIYGVV